MLQWTSSHQRNCNQLSHAFSIFDSIAFTIFSVYPLVTEQKVIKVGNGSELSNILISFQFLRRFLTKQYIWQFAWPSLPCTLCWVYTRNAKFIYNSISIVRRDETRRIWPTQKQTIHVIYFRFEPSSFVFICMFAYWDRSSPHATCSTFSLSLSSSFPLCL